MSYVPNVIYFSPFEIKIFPTGYRSLSTTGSNVYIPEVN